MRGGSNAVTIKQSNRLAVLERIRLQTPVTRAEIARDTGLTAAAVTNIVARLLDEGLAVETGRRQMGRGQPPVELDLAANGAFSVGIHLDRDLLSGVLVDLKGTSRNTVRWELTPPRPEEAVALLANCFEELISKGDVDTGKLLGVGVVTVGPLDLEKGTVRGPPNFPGWQDVPLREQLQQKLQLPVILENNATAAAMGEHWYGAGKGHPNFLYVYIGLGVGGGLFIDNRVYRGSGLNAGEFGYMLVRENDELVPLESVTSVLALQRELGMKYRDLNQISAAFEAGDEELLDWLQRASGFLAQAIAGIDNLLDLDAVILGGRHSLAVLSHLVALIEEQVKPLVMPNRPRYAQVIAGHAGEDTAALGAATLPFYQAFAETPQ